MRLLSFEFIAIFIISILAALMISPYFSVLLLGSITAYILYPMVFSLKKIVRSYTIAIFISVMIIISIFFFITNLVIRDAAPLISGISGLAGDVTTVLETLKPQLENLGLSEYITNTQKIIATVETYAKTQLLENLKSLPGIMLNFLIYIFATFYFLKDGTKIKNKIYLYVQTLSLNDKKTATSIIDGLKNSFDVLFFSYITLSIFSVIIAWLGFTALGIPYALILSILIGIASFLPLIGMPWIYVPLAGYEYYIGNELTAIYVLIFSIVGLNIIPDMIIRPAIGAKIGNVHPLTILLGFFGGPVLFGMMGFIIGPIILVIAETVIRSYMDLKIETANIVKTKKR
ncbi:MAG: AI-2E family transporter [Candidatus Aenigmarchaeota archaeon]|nr:AI-2E family transporter [Candidatus Aenigmarchaeota archaeon]